MFVNFFLPFNCFGKCKIKLKYKNNITLKKNSIALWHNVIKKMSKKYHIDSQLVNAIIYVESAGNPNAISNSNAIGLMQIKSNSAGREVYKIEGKKGSPSISELLNPVKNIEIGSKYIQILQNKNLKGIININNLRYATIVSYCNGINAFLKIFSANKKKAIIKINCMSSKKLIDYVDKYHPSKQAIKYLLKVLKVYKFV